MKCNVCGGDIPEGAPNCPICGAPAPAPAPQGNAYGVDPNAQYGGAPVNQPSQDFGGYDQQPYPQNNMGAYQAAAAKKSNTGLIIGIGAVVAVVVAVVVMWALGVFGGGDHDGTYKLDRATAMGFEIDSDQLATYGMDPEKYTIKIHGSNADLDMGGVKSSCSVKFSGSTITLSGGGQELEGEYTNGEIKISYGGVDMVFAK